MVYNIKSEKIVSDISIHIERIIQIRKTIGLSQSDFAKKIDVKPNHISSMENGRNKTPSFAVILGIWRNIDNVNIEYIFSGQGEPFFSESFKKSQIEDVKNQLYLLEKKIKQIEKDGIR